MNGLELELAKSNTNSGIHCDCNKEFLICPILILNLNFLFDCKINSTQAEISDF